MMKTLVLGASPNPERYGNIAVKRLQSHGIPVVPVGQKKGLVGGLEILHGQPVMDDIHTVTLYLNPTNQQPYYEYIIGLKPQRIIFNPGTENPELMALARKNNIEVEVACTLVMLATGVY